MDDPTRWRENGASNGTRLPGPPSQAGAPLFFSSLRPDPMCVGGVADFSRLLTRQFLLATHACRWAAQLNDRHC